MLESTTRTSSSGQLARHPFATWVIFGGLLYAGLGMIALPLQSLATGGALITDPFALTFLLLGLLFIVAAAVSLTEKRGAIIFATVLTFVFLVLTLPFSVGTLTNPADPSFWLLMSAIPVLVLVAIFAIASWANFRTGIRRKRYLATPHSSGGLLTLGVVGFVAGAVLVGAMAGPLVAGILEGMGESVDVAIVRDAASQDTPEAYSPVTLTVSAGQTVTWLNADTTIHTVTSETGLFDSGNLRPGERFSFTFTMPGTYAYFCTPHPWMTGTVVVTSGG